jgi:hypothetical protein
MQSVRTFVTKREPRGPHEQLYQPEIPLSREHAVVPLIWIWILWPAVSGSSCTRTRTVFLYARTHARTHARTYAGRDRRLVRIRYACWRAQKRRNVTDWPASWSAPAVAIRTPLKKVEGSSSHNFSSIRRKLQVVTLTTP